MRSARTVPSWASSPSRTTSACSSYLQPDLVHILIDGRIVDSGGPELAERLERDGYDSWRTTPEATPESQSEATTP